MKVVEKKLFAIKNANGDVLYETLSSKKLTCENKFMGIMADTRMTFNRLKKEWGFHIIPVTLSYEVKDENNS